jgi:Ca2+/Na+ antiporter
VKATVAASNETRLFSPALVAAIILNPLLMMPTIGTASTLAQNGHTGRALSAMVGTALLNLCLLLPIAILLHVGLHSADKLKTIQTTRELLNQLSASALPYPMAAWRIDNVLLVVLGFAAIPVAMGRWAITRLDSVLLVFGFLAYLIATAIAVLWGHLP